MPSRLETPVLTVEAGLLLKVDTRNVENLYSMWSVFSRCAGSLEEGRRLENLSWRLWNRETFCCEPGEATTTTPAILITQRNSEGRYTKAIPDLSRCVNPVDEEAIEFDNEECVSTSAPLDLTRPRILRQDSRSNRSRGRERHITPDDLEKMVMTIKEKKDLQPLDPSTYSYLAPLPTRNLVPAEKSIPSPTTTAPIPIEQELTNSPSVSDKSSHAASESVSARSERSTTSIVRGFSPSSISLSYRSIPLLVAPSSIRPSLPKSTLASLLRTGPKKHTMFALGGSCQSGNDSFNETSSVETKVLQGHKKTNTVFRLGGSSGEDESLVRDNMKSKQHSSLSYALRHPQQNKKQTSFKREVATQTIHENRVMDDDVFKTDDKDEVDESAIDDDDSSDWEDSLEESGKSSIDEKLPFQRVDSRPNRTSRRSLITTMLHQNDRVIALTNAASKSTPTMHRSRISSPKGLSLAASLESDDAAPLVMKKETKPVREISRTATQPIIVTTTNTTPHQAALSPRATRRKMLATELTASLRRHLLWERQQKNQTATAVLKRRHTAHDVANLKRYPEKVHLGIDDQTAKGLASYNQCFSKGSGEYHSRGW